MRKPQGVNEENRNLVLKDSHRPLACSCGGSNEIWERYQIFPYGFFSRVFLQSLCNIFFEIPDGIDHLKHSRKFILTYERLLFMFRNMAILVLQSGN